MISDEVQSRVAETMNEAPVNKNATMPEELKTYLAFGEDAMSALKQFDEMVRHQVMAKHLIMVKHLPNRKMDFSMMRPLRHGHSIKTMSFSLILPDSMRARSTLSPHGTT